MRTRTMLFLALVFGGQTLVFAQGFHSAGGGTPPASSAPQAVPYRTGSCSLVKGGCNIIWPKEFSSSPVPVGQPAAVGAPGGPMIQCQWTSMSTGGAAVACIGGTDGLVVSGTAVQP